MALRTPAGESERGFTLAGLIVVMTVMMIFVAYTVPRQWSTIMQRERELQTIFIMKQYARAIHEFSRKNANAFPVSMEQLQKAATPRFVRGKTDELIDPLSGQADWLIIPASAAATTGQVIPGTGGSGPTPTPTPTPNTDTSATTSTNGIGTVPTSTDTTATASQPTGATVPAIPMKDYAGGPFIGIRPGKSGKSFLEFKGAQSYEQWSYTVLDYRNEMNARIAAASKLWQ